MLLAAERPACAGSCLATADDKSAKCCGSPTCCSCCMMLMPKAARLGAAGCWLRCALCWKQQGKQAVVLSPHHEAEQDMEGGCHHHGTAV